MSSPSITVTSMNYTIPQQKALAICPKISALLSFLCSSLVAVQIIQKRKRKSDGTVGGRKKSTKSLNLVYRRLVLGMSCADICSSVAFFCSTWLIPSSSSSLGENILYGSSGSTGTCTAQGFLAYMTVISVCYNSCLAFYYFLVIGKGWNDKKMSKQSRKELAGHAVVLSYGIVTGIIGASLNMFNSVGWTCWISPFPSGCVESWRLPSVPSSDDTKCERGDNATLFLWIAFYIPIWLAIVFITVMMSSVYRSVRRTEERGLKYSMQAAASKASNGSRGSKFSNIFLRNPGSRSGSRPNISRQSSLNSFSLNNSNSRRNMLESFNDSRRNLVDPNNSKSGSLERGQFLDSELSKDGRPLHQKEEPYQETPSLIAQLSASRGMSMISTSTAGGRNSMGKASRYGGSPSNRRSMSTQHPPTGAPVPPIKVLESEASNTFDKEISKSNQSSITEDTKTATHQHQEWGDGARYVSNSCIAENPNIAANPIQSSSNESAPQQMCESTNGNERIVNAHYQNDDGASTLDKSRDNGASSNDGSCNSHNFSLNSSLVFSAHPQAPEAPSNNSSSTSLDPIPKEIQGHRRSSIEDNRMLSTIMSESLIHVSQRSLGTKASRHNSGMNRSVSKKGASSKSRSKNKRPELGRSGSSRRFNMHIPADVIHEKKAQASGISAAPNNRGSSMLRRFKFLGGSASVAGGSLRDADSRVGIGSVTSHNSRDALKKSRKVANQAIFYVGSLIITWLVPTIQSLFYTVTGRRNFGLLLFESLCVPTAGIWNLLMYLRPTYHRCRKRYTTISTLKLWQMLLMGKSEQDIKMLHKHLVKQQRKQAHKDLLARQRELQTQLKKQKETELEVIPFPIPSAPVSALPSIFEDKGGGRRAIGGIKAEMERQAAMEPAADDDNKDTPAVSPGEQKRMSLLLRQVSGRTKTSFDPSSYDNRSSEFGSSDNSKSTRLRKTRREKLINNWQANYNNYPGRHRIGDRASHGSFTPLDKEEELMLWQPVTSNPDHLVRSGSAIPATGRHLRGDVEDHRHNARVQVHRRLRGSSVSLSLSGGGGNSSNQDVDKSYVSHSGHSSYYSGGRISQRGSSQSLPEYLRLGEKTHPRLKSRLTSDSNDKETDDKEQHDSSYEDDVSEAPIFFPKKSKLLHPPRARIPVSVSMQPRKFDDSPQKKTDESNGNENGRSHELDDNKRSSLASSVTMFSNHRQREASSEKGIHEVHVSYEVSNEHRRRASSITLDDEAAIDAIASISLSKHARGSVESLASIAANNDDTRPQKTATNHQDYETNSVNVVESSSERQYHFSPMSARKRAQSFISAANIKGDDKSNGTMRRSSSVATLDRGTIEKVKRASSIVVPGGLVNDLPGVDLLSANWEELDDDDDDDDDENVTASNCSVALNEQYAGNRTDALSLSFDNHAQKSYLDVCACTSHVPNDGSDALHQNKIDDLVDNKHDSDYFHSSIHTSESFAEGNDNCEKKASSTRSFLHFGTTSSSSLGSIPEGFGDRQCEKVPVTTQSRKLPALPSSLSLEVEAGGEDLTSAGTVIELNNITVEDGLQQSDISSEVVSSDDIAPAKKDKSIFINEESILSDDIEAQTSEVEHSDTEHSGHNFG